MFLIQILSVLLGIVHRRHFLCSLVQLSVVGFARIGGDLRFAISSLVSPLQKAFGVLVPMLVPVCLDYQRSFGQLLVFGV